MNLITKAPINKNKRPKPFLLLNALIIIFLFHYKSGIALLMLLDYSLPNDSVFINIVITRSSILKVSLIFALKFLFLSLLRRTREDQNYEKKDLVCYDI